MRIRRTALIYWIPPVVWMILIFSASSDRASYAHTSRFFEPLLRYLFPWLAQEHVDEIHHLFRKCGHLTEYAVLAGLLWLAIRRTDPPLNHQWRWAQAGLALAGVLVYAASDEFHQAFVPGRTALVSDVLIDTSGGAVGLAVLWLIGRIFKRW